jgi:flavin reductase (DIM6/NTAB) family NADH-FMN oxidoreductase RutF
MYQGFISVIPDELNESAFKLIGKDWMLVAAGNISDYNMMTASWGSFGVLWNRPIVSVFVRPPRYTYDYMESNLFFTLCFFDYKYRNLLNLLGSKSGRDIEKMKIDELDSQSIENRSVFFDQARLVIECKKLYFNDINPANFLDSTLDGHYPKADYHRMYIGEVMNVFKKV